MILLHACSFKQEGNMKNNGKKLVRKEDYIFLYIRFIFFITQQCEKWQESWLWQVVKVRSVFNTFRFIHLAKAFQGDLVKRQAIHHMESTAPAILQYAKPKNTWYLRTEHFYMHANTDEIIHLEKLKLNALKEAGNLIPNIKCIYCNLNLFKVPSI